LIVALFISTNGEFEFLAWVEVAVEHHEGGKVKHEINCKVWAIKRRRVSNIKIIVLVLVPDDVDRPSTEYFLIYWQGLMLLLICLVFNAMQGGS